MSLIKELPEQSEYLASVENARLFITPTGKVYQQVRDGYREHPKQPFANTQARGMLKLLANRGRVVSAVELSRMHFAIPEGVEGPDTKQAFQDCWAIIHRYHRSLGMLSTTLPKHLVGVRGRGYRFTDKPET